MTHDELVQRAKRWLLKSERCPVAFAEPCSGNIDERPDAIGWRYGGASVLIECKVSINDFYSDKAKPFRRQPYLGMGMFRWIMSPKGLLRPEQLLPDWGLLEVRGASMRCYRVKNPSAIPEYNKLTEIKLLAGKCWNHPEVTIVFDPNGAK